MSITGRLIGIGLLVAGSGAVNSLSAACVASQYRLQFVDPRPIFVQQGANSTLQRVLFVYRGNALTAPPGCPLTIDPTVSGWSIFDSSIASLNNCNSGNSCSVHGGSVGQTNIRVNASNNFWGLDGSLLKPVVVTSVPQTPAGCIDSAGLVVPCGGGCIVTSAAASLSSTRVALSSVQAVSSSQLAVLPSCAPKSSPVEIVTSNDPNDKVGSPGFGVGKFISATDPARYTIFFENKSDASAPAQEVVVTDRFDTSSADVATLVLGSIIFPGKVITPPSIPLSAIGTYSTSVDLRPTQNLVVNVVVTLDVPAGILTWRFKSVDPATGSFPDDPFAGFLPPAGEGSVSFTVGLRAGISTGGVVRNRATIVFDTNPPLDTPEWLNTVDSSKPSSNVTALQPTQTSLSFPVSWQGSDAGSGIGKFSIYVSDNGSPFTVWQSNTSASSAVFTGQAGHTYGFYSIARDGVGNIESGKSSAEATTRVADSSCAVSAGSGVTVTRSGFRLIATTQRFVQTVSLKNVTAASIQGPLSLVLDGLSSNAGLFNKSGTSSCAAPLVSPFINANLGVPNTLAPNQTVTLTLEFTNPSNQGITYTTRVLTGAGSR